MARETKNVITKESIAKELRAENKKRFPVLLLFLLVYVLVASSVLLAIYFLGLKNTGAGVVGYVFFFICALICLLPLLSFLLSFIIRPKGLKSTDFLVMTDEVAFKEEKPATIRGRIVRMKKVLHFRTHEEMEVNSTWYQITSEKDVFYMVVRDQNSKSALRCYPAKLYEYVE